VIQCTIFFAGRRISEAKFWISASATPHIQWFSCCLKCRAFLIVAGFI